MVSCIRILDPIETDPTRSVTLISCVLYRDATRSRLKNYHCLLIDCVKKGPCPRLNPAQRTSRQTVVKIHPDLNHPASIILGIKRAIYALIF